MDSANFCYTRAITLYKSSQSADIRNVAVLSIQRYLDDCSTENTNPLLGACGVLLDGIARSALAYDRAEYATFRATLRQIHADLKNRDDPAEFTAAAARITKALDDYNRGAQRTQAAETVELRCVIEMLSRTLVSLARAGAQSAQILQTIGQQVENATRVDDIRLVRAQLGESLKEISQEATRQRERTQEILRHAQEAGLLSSEHADDAATDRISGLPWTATAETTIAPRVGPGSESSPPRVVLATSC